MLLSTALFQVRTGVTASFKLSLQRYLKSLDLGVIASWDLNACSADRGGTRGSYVERVDSDSLILWSEENAMNTIAKCLEAKFFLSDLLTLSFLLLINFFPSFFRLETSTTVDSIYYIFRLHALIASDTPPHIWANMTIHISAIRQHH